MKGILLAFTSFFFLALVSAPAVRLYSGKKYFRPLIAVFGLSALLYTLLFRLFSADLGFLTEEWRVSETTLDYANGLLILFLLFHSFWDTLYTSFFTGFSSAILIRFAEAGDGGLSREELAELYRKSSGEHPVIDRRLENLLGGGYLAAEGPDRFRLLPKGRFFAQVALMLQRIFHMGEGG